jgi:hypothetical protein
MIVQTAPEGAPRFVIRMSEHTALAGAFARAFGNDRFEPVESEEAHFIIANHDIGWAPLDAEYRLDPKTGFPYNLVDTPFDLIMGTSRRSPDVNERKHPFCGLISSMHTWGLYNGRYGMSDAVLLDQIAHDHREMADAMLAHELARQDRLKETLAADDEAADLIEGGKVMAAYKQLQFFDTLALYFNRIHEDERKQATFTHVPLNEEDDVDVTITPLGGGRYSLSPWPFAGDRLTVSFEGRYMDARKGEDRAPEAAKLPVETQTVTLVAG